MLTLKLNVDGLERKLSLMVDALSDLEKPLARAGGILRAEAKKSFASRGPGWPALSDETEKRKPSMKALGFYSLNDRKRSRADTVTTEDNKLQRALARAEKAKTDKAQQKALAAADVHRSNLETLQRAYGAALRTSDTSALVAVARKELRRRKIRGAAMRAARQIEDETERRRVARLGSTRYRRDARSLDMLGSLRDSISLYVTEQSVSVFSHSMWAGVHNDGGRAGNNATIPKRTFLEFTDRSLGRIVDLLKEQLISAWVE